MTLLLVGSRLRFYPEMKYIYDKLTYLLTCLLACLLAYLPTYLLTYIEYIVPNKRNTKNVPLYQLI